MWVTEEHELENVFTVARRPSASRWTPRTSRRCPTHGLPGLSESFTGELDLIGALLLKWHARLSGNIAHALAREPMDLESAAAVARHVGERARIGQPEPAVAPVLASETPTPTAPGNGSLADRIRAVLAA